MPLTRPAPVIALLFGLLAHSAVAQYNPDGSSRIYNNDFQFGLGLHTLGTTLGAKLTRNKTYYVKKQYEVDFVASMKHDREFKYRNTGARSFVFGKQFSMGVLRAMYGRQRILADYINSMSVRVNFHYSAGINLGLLKPIYYLVSDPVDNKTVEVRFDPDQHFYATQFYGEARWNKGINELEFRPGISGKAALSFEWGSRDHQFKSLETGVMLDFFGQRVPIMAFAQNDFLFVNLYAVLMIGNRW
ncbi:MAG: hypothetical protein HYZ16_12010 [Bacteroidetes bacterium]|jgi:hypothetical protein|nr:hypothetical protein [Bacteroidota bacterium]